MKESSRIKPIRPFAREDIPEVTDMFQRLLLSDGPPRRKLPPTALHEYFSDIFFNNPWYDETLPSLIYQGSNGKIIGFLGVVPRRMLLRDQPIRVAISFHFMVEPEARSTLAGMHLLKTFFAGPQDLSLTDGAGDIGRKIWEGVGGMTALLYSQSWTRILQPGQQAINLLTENTKYGRYRLFSTIARALSPFRYFADAAAARLAPHYFSGRQPQFSEEELKAQTILTQIPQFSRMDALRPSYDGYSLEWLLEQAAQIKLFGLLQKVVVRDARGEVAGWYMYYLNPGGTSTVFQIVARKSTINEILNHLFDHARRHGSAAIAGRMQPQFMQELSDNHCFFTRTGGWVLIHSNNNELLNVIHRGDAFLTGLEGEWCLLF